ALHEKDKRTKGSLTRIQFFLIIFTASFAYYIIPSYLFPTIGSISIACCIWKNSVVAQQISSSIYGLGIGSFTFDWSAISSFLGSPLANPGFAIINQMAGFFLFVYIVLPIAYYTNVYEARKFPFISSHVFDYTGHKYNVSRIVDEKTFSLDMPEYNNYNKIYLSVFFALSYGMGFAALAATISHVILFYGK
ncbi:oligopeptide transporter, partial [Dionaea muscipula]